MRYAKRTDDNHSEIRDGLRKAGYPVLDLSGCGHGVPDLSVMIGERRSIFMEVKDGAKARSAQKLTAAEEKWMEFNGSFTYVVKSLDQALRVIREIEG